MPAVLTPIQWAAFVAAIGLGVTAVWFFNRKQGIAAPRVRVVGFSDSAGFCGIRKLKVQDNAVTWLDDTEDPEAEETGCVIPLRPEFRYSTEEGAWYFADLTTGKVFRPSPEPGEDDTIDGRILFKHARTQEAEKWASAKEAGLFKLARYAPWAFGLIIAFLAVLAYGMFGQ